MNCCRPDVARFIHWYVRRLEGGDWPFLSDERRYLSVNLEPGSSVADLGGGEGRLRVHMMMTFRKRGVARQQAGG